MRANAMSPKTNAAILFLAIFAVIGVSSTASASATHYAIASGNWNANATWSDTSGGAAGSSFPVAGDVVYIADASVARTVTIPAGYAAACSSLTLGTIGNAAVGGLTFSAANSTLAVSGNVRLNRGANNTTTITLGAGAMTVGGDVTLSYDTTLDANVNRINSITLSTGTLTISGNLYMLAESLGQSRITFSGAGTMNLAGSFNTTNVWGAPGYYGTLTPNVGTVNFNGTVAQTIPIGLGSVTYYNVNVNNTSGSGATLGDAIGATLVTRDLTVQSGILNNGGFAHTMNTRVFTVANGATFNLTGTSTMIGGTSSKSFGATSTVNYQGANQTVTAETYGHLILSGSGTKTMPATTTTVAGNFTMSGTASATAGAAINTAGNVTLGSGTTFDAVSYTHNVAGNWNNNGATFTYGTSTINLNGANQVVDGTSGSDFNNVSINSSAAVTFNAAISNRVFGVITSPSSKYVGTSGAGDLVLVGNNSGWNGPLSLYSTGKLFIKHSNALGADPGTTIATQLYVAAAGSLMIERDVTLGANRGVTLAATPVIDVSDPQGYGVTCTVNSVITGAGGITKTGSKKLQLNGANNYSGATTVNGGVLGGKGSGSSATTINNTGTISPGASMGVLETAALTLNAGSTYDWEFSASSASSDYINVTGNLLIPAAADSVTVNVQQIDGALATPLPLFNVSGTKPTSNNIVTAMVFMQGGLPLASENINFNGDLISLAPVPEPAVLGVVALALLALRRKS